MACEAALLALSEKKAQAAFPDKNGGIAYNNNGVIYTINPGGGGKTKVTRDGDEPSYSPDGKKLVYSGNDGNDSELYTINSGGGGKFKVTDNGTDDYDPSWGVVRSGFSSVREARPGLGEGRVL